MYKLKNKIYADVGYILHYDKQRSFICNEDKTPVEEEINTNLITRMGDMIFIESIPIKVKKLDYGSIKAKLISLMYSKDDQIAIILNKDDSEEDKLRFNKMQEWREWCSEVSKLIINKLNK